MAGYAYARCDSAVGLHWCFKTKSGVMVACSACLHVACSMLGSLNHFSLPSLSCMSQDGEPMWRRLRRNADGDPVWTQDGVLAWQRLLLGVDEHQLAAEAPAAPDVGAGAVAGPASAAEVEVVTSDDDPPAWHHAVPTSSTLMRLQRHALRAGPIGRLRKSTMESWRDAADADEWGATDPHFIRDACLGARMGHADHDEQGPHVMVEVRLSWIEEWYEWSQRSLHRQSRDGRPRKQGPRCLAAGFSADVAAIVGGAPMAAPPYADILRDRA